MTSGPFAYRCKGDCPVREAKRGRQAPCERITKGPTPNQHRFSRNGHLFTFAVFQHSRSNILEEKKSRRRGHWPQQRIKVNLRVPPPISGEYQSQLWRAADTLRGNIDAAEYKHVVLPLIFLKYISDAFEELHEELESKADEGMDSEEPDYYTANNVFWVPKEARWSTIQSQARQNTNGTTIDQAMTAIERDNSALRGVLDLVSNIKVGGADAQATDVLGRVYEYFLEQFAMAEGRKGGEFYTPRSVVQLLVAMIEPYKGRVYDPCCGSAGMFIQSVRFIEAHATGNGNGEEPETTCPSTGRNRTRLHGASPG